MSDAQYSVRQVLAAERVSRTPAGSGEVWYSYDGISFWRHAADGNRVLTRPSEVPASGWRHREDYNCALCREASAAWQRRRRPSGR